MAASRASGLDGEAGSQWLVQKHQDSRSTAGIVTQQDPMVSERAGLTRSFAKAEIKFKEAGI